MRSRHSIDYADAAIDCTNAGFAACAAMTAASFECWRRTFDAASLAPAPRSWYRKPAFAPSASARRASSALWPDPWPRAGWSQVNPWLFPYAGAAPASLGAAWFAMLPFEGPPASWPLAFAMIANGVPRSVALPMAEANVAAAEAAESATRPWRRALTAYRGDSGYAVSPFVPPSAAMLGALALGLGERAWPWLSAPPAPFVF